MIGVLVSLFDAVPRCVNGSTRLSCCPALPVLLVLAVVVAFVLPGRAAASCGAHVQTAGKPDGQKRCLHGDCPVVPLVPIGCTGPTCRERQESLPPVSVSPPPVVPEWALGTIARQPAAQSPAGRPAETAGVRAFHRAFPPEPPPRSSSR